MSNSKQEIEYLMLFSSIHENFLSRKEQLSEQLSDYYLDFDRWKITTEGTGFTNIWVEPKYQLIYKPTFNSSFKEVQIKGLKILVKAKVITIKTGKKLVNFEISGNFNPNTWDGRNKLNLQPIGEIVVSGFCRTIIEQDNFFSPYFLKYVDQNYLNFIFSSIKFFS